jgi:hypothetical protein
MTLLPAHPRPLYNYTNIPNGTSHGGLLLAFCASLIQLALERLLLFLLRVRSIASAGAQLLHGSSAIARELSAENAAWGRGERRHGRVYSVSNYKGIRKKINVQIADPWE